MLHQRHQVAAAALLLPAFALAAPFAYITNQGSHDVSVIDLATQQVVRTLGVGRAPAGVVASSRAGKVFVSNPDSRSISVIDMREQRVVGTLAAGEGPVGIDASPDGSLLFAADWYANRLMVFDTRGAGAELARIAVGRAPAGVAAHPDNDTVFVAERDDDSVAVVSVRERRVLARVKVGSHPFALLLDAARRRLYALNVQSDDVSVIDIGDIGDIGNIGDARDTHDTAALRVIATVKVGKAPYGAALAQNGSLLYVTNQHDDSVSVVDAESLTVLRTLGGFGYPEGVAAHGDKVYVVNWMDDQVSVLDAASGQALRHIATGKNSRGFGAFIGAP
ncbi:YncE family protein [Sphaerotilaceae bacterium SBD11-9]